MQPADSIGLAFGQRATLVIGYSGPGGLPIAGARVGFALVQDLPNESAGGSTLSSAAAASDGSGMARVDVVAGAATASFRVRADAEDALPVYVTVAVSNVGFASLEVVPVHLGQRDAVDSVEVRLYRGSVRCSTLTPETPLASPYPSRTTGTGAAAVFEALSPESDYAALAWMMSAGGPVDADGCVDLAPRQLRAGARVQLLLPVADRPLLAAAEYQAVSTFDLTPLHRAVIAPGSAWVRAGCPLGAAELILDCVIDGLDRADPDDCVVESPGDAATALMAQRGAVEEGGCHAGGELTLEGRLAPMLAAPATGLPAAAAALADLLDTLSLESTITLTGPAARQRLVRATLESGGTLIHTQLGTTARPVLFATAPALRQRDSDEIQLGTLAYTLRLGDLAARAMKASIGDVRHLGAPLLGSAHAGGETGCAAVSLTVCPAAGLPADCLTTACSAATPALEAALAAPFARLDGSGIDFMLEGSAVLMDVDHDFQAEQLLGGSWNATARLAGGMELMLQGVFQATAR